MLKLSEKLTFGCFMAHEQYCPLKLLEYAQKAEKVGFDWIWCSDHFHPWFHSGANAGFAWVWLASALEKVPRVMMGTGVTTPYLRYHPALVAQAFATLGYMYPGRVFLGLGMGEAMNEVPLGYEWPDVKKRIKMFEEAIQIIKLLWEGNFVNFKGSYFKLRNAKLYTLPKKEVPLIVASNNPKVAEIAGKYADGFLTAATDLEYINNVLFKSLEKGANRVGKDYRIIKKCLHMILSYDEDEDSALKACRKWAAVLVKKIFSKNVYDPRKLEELGKKITDKELSKSFIVSNNPETFIKKAIDYIKVGFTHINFSSISPSQDRFLDMFGKEVLPILREISPQ